MLTTRKAGLRIVSAAAIRKLSVAFRAVGLGPPVLRSAHCCIVLLQRVVLMRRHSRVVRTMFFCLSLRRSLPGGVGEGEIILAALAAWGLKTRLLKLGGSREFASPQLHATKRLTPTPMFPDMVAFAENPYKLDLLRRSLAGLAPEPQATLTAPEYHLPEKSCSSAAPKLLWLIRRIETRSRLSTSLNQAFLRASPHARILGGGCIRGESVMDLV